MDQPTDPTLPSSTSPRAGPGRPRRSLAAAGLAAGLVVTGVAGGAVLGAPVITGAQTTTTPEEGGTTVPEEGTTGAPEIEGETRAPGDHLRDTLQPLVEDGTLTTDQVEAVVTALQDAHPAGGHRPGGPRGGHVLADVETAAEVLGLTPDEVREGLAAGSSLADLAAAQGVDVQVLIDSLVASLTEQLNDDVASGDKTQEQMDARLTEATERITAMVEGNLPGPGDRHPGMGGRPPGVPGFGPDAGSEDETDSGS